MIFFYSTAVDGRLRRGGKSGKEWKVMGIGLVSEIELSKRGLGGNSIVIRWEEADCAGGKFG